MYTVSLTSTVYRASEVFGLANMDYTLVTSFLLNSISEQVKGELLFLTTTI